MSNKKKKRKEKKRHLAIVSQVGLSNNYHWSELNLYEAPITCTRLRNIFS